MKLVLRLAILTSSFLLSGCLVPAEMFFRNKSTEVVRLHGVLVDRRRFDRLPNKATLYDFPKKEKAIYGNWRQDTFVTWLDTTHFFVDIPPETIVDLEDVTDKFTLGLSFPKVLLLATTKNRTDTIAKGINGDPFITKFKEKSRFMGKSTFYYDFE